MRFCPQGAARIHAFVIQPRGLASAEQIWRPRRWRTHSGLRRLRGRGASRIIGHMPFVSGELDSRIAIVTPENIAFHYRLAGPFRRLIAYLIDFGIRLVAVVITLVVVLFAGRSLVGIGIGMACVGWLILSWFYGGLFETFWNGQTPGKWVMGLRTLTIDGQPINALQAVLRNILRAVDTMPVVPISTESLIPILPVYTLGLLTMALTDRYQRWGDLACGTMVVIEDRQRLRGVVPIGVPEVVELAAHLPANFTASPSLARALSAYVERGAIFLLQRRAEIARILGEPLAQRFGLPANISHDLLICALYYHVFIADRAAQAGQADKPVGFEAGGTAIDRWLDAQ